MFSHKVVLITGGSGALGSVVVDAFLRKGATVAAVDLNAKTISRGTAKTGGELHTFSADLTKEKNVAALFDDIEQKFGGTDILVHTVGGFWGGKSIQETDVEKWDHMMSLNLRTAFLCSKYALSHMQKKGGGKIITMAAMAALEPKSNRAAYLTSKAGVVALTQAIAKEGEAINVQANALAPSIILTEANKESMPDMDSSEWVKPENIADTILYLCSESARSITGTVIKML